MREWKVDKCTSADENTNAFGEIRFVDEKSNIAKVKFDLKILETEELTNSRKKISMKFPAFYIVINSSGCPLHEFIFHFSDRRFVRFL